MHPKYFCLCFLQVYVMHLSCRKFGYLTRWRSSVPYLGQGLGKTVPNLGRYTPSSEVNKIFYS